MYAVFSGRDNLRRLIIKYVNYKDGEYKFRFIRERVKKSHTLRALGYSFFFFFFNI